MENLTWLKSFETPLACSKSGLPSTAGSLFSSPLPFLYLAFKKKIKGGIWITNKLFGFVLSREMKALKLVEKVSRNGLHWH